MINRNKTLWVGFAGVISLALILHFTNLVKLPGYWLLDSQFRLLRDIRPVKVKQGVVIVGIDEASFRSYKEPLTLWHPHFASFLHAMEISQPAAIGIDMVLPDKSYNFLIPGYDLPLLEALQSIRGKIPLVLAQTIDEYGELRPLFTPIVSFAGKDAIALPLVQTESDGLVRNFQPTVDTTRASLPTLAGLLATKLGYKTDKGLINFAVGEAFDYIPFHQVLTWYKQGTADKLQAAFKDKVVFLGAILPLEDRHRMPVKLASWEPENKNLPGVLIHAQSLRTLAHQGTIQPAPISLVLFILLIVSMIWWIKRPLKWGTPVLLIGLLLLSIISTYTITLGWHMPLASLGAAAIFAWLARLSLDSIYTAIEKRRLNQSFGGYVSPNVMQEIIAGKIHPNMRGERTRICILFSDIRNFTGRSEHQPPEAIIELLNDYFDEMTAAVHEHGGTVDKFIGDGLMAFFGAPYVSPDPARDAFESAKQMIGRLEPLNARLVSKNIEPVQIGIGLHIGDAVVGHVGSKNRHEYTVIGDTVNSAARLESLTKELGYPILVSADVAEALGFPDSLSDLGTQKVKGRAAIHVYGWRP